MSEIREAVEAAHKELSEDNEAPTADEKEPEIETQAEDAPEPDSEDAPAPAPEPEPVSPPETWAENTALWESLTPEAQAQIVTREEAFATQLQESQTAASPVNPELEQVLSAIRADAAQAGMTDVQALSRLFNAHSLLRTNPTWGARQVLNLYNIDPASLVETAPIEGQDSQADPYAAQLGQVMQAVNTLAQNVDQRFQQSALDSLTSQVDAWAQERDANGDLKRPLFEEVGEEVAALVPVLQKANPGMDGFSVMQQAYDRVIAGRQPTDFDARVEAEVAKRLEAQKAETDKAKAAASSVPSAPSGSESTPPPQSNGSVRGDVEAAYKQLQGSSRI